MDVKFEFSYLNSEKMVAMSTNTKIYIFKVLVRLDKNGKEYFGLFTKNSYKGYLHTSKMFGIIKLGDSEYSFRCLDPDKGIYSFTEKVAPLKKNDFRTNHKYHEDNIKFDIFSRLKSAGILCQLEYTLKDCRIDIAILNDVGKPLGFIEVKKPSSKYEIVKRSNIRIDRSNVDEFILTKQLKKYVSKGYPLFISTGYQNIPLAVAFAKSISGIKE